MPLLMMTVLLGNAAVYVLAARWMWNVYWSRIPFAVHAWTFLVLCVIPFALTWATTSLFHRISPRAVLSARRSSSIAPFVCGMTIVGVWFILATLGVTFASRLVSDEICVALSSVIASVVALSMQRRSVPGQCLACGYDITHSIAFGRCPECGIAIGRSTATD